MPVWTAKGIDPTLTEDQRQRLMKEFDFDGDGRLSKQDLKRGFRKMGIHFCGWRAGRALRHADANKDRFISKDELDELVKYAAKWGFPRK